MYNFFVLVWFVKTPSPHNLLIVGIKQIGLEQPFRHDTPVAVNITRKMSSAAYCAASFAKVPGMLPRDFGHAAALLRQEM